MQPTPTTLPSAVDRNHHSDDDDGDDNGDVCRVCRLSETPDNPLFHPCLCRGSIKYVHQSCLMDWLEHRPRGRGSKCELCHHPLSFTPIYSTDAPEALTCKEVVSGVIIRTSSWLPQALRLALVLISWFFLVPLLTFVFFRCCLSSFFDSSQFISAYTGVFDIYTLWRDSQYGLLICVNILVLSMILASFRDLFVPEEDGGDPVAADHAAGEDAFPDAFEAAFDHIDVPAAQWIGVDGPWRYFAMHVSSVLFYNFMFLLLTLGVPLRIGRITLSFFGIDTTKLSWISLLSLRKFLEGSLLDTASWSALSSSWFSDDIMQIIHDSNALDYVLTVGLGYLLLLAAALLWIVVSTISSSLPCARAVRSFLHQLYLAFKVSFFLGSELLVCPVLFGVVIDAMTLDLRQITWTSRRISAFNWPISSAFLYWLAGIVLIVFMSVFASVLRQTLRRDVYLLFLRDPDDPDFHPIQELIDHPFLGQFRRLLLSAGIYIALIGLCVHIPSRIALRLVPSLAPLHFRFGNFVNMPSELLIYHLIMPFVLETLLIEKWHVRFTQAWFRVTCKALSLSHILLQEDAPRPGIPQVAAAPLPVHPADLEPPVEQNSQASHEAAGFEPPVEQNHQASQEAADLEPSLEQNQASQEFCPQSSEEAAVPSSDFVSPASAHVGGEESLERDNHLMLRVFLLLLMGWITHIVVVTATGILPLLTGRLLLERAASVVTYHDFYAYMVGLNLCLGIVCAIERIGRMALRRDFARVFATIAQYMIVIFKSLSLFFFGGALLPLAVGLIIDLTIVIPTWVPLNESPMISVAQDMAIGVVFLKIWSRVEMTGLFGETQRKRVLEQIERDGVEGLRVMWILQNAVWPLLIKSIAYLAMPYAFSRGIYPLFDGELVRQSIVLRYSFVALLIIKALLWAISLGLRWYVQLEARMFEDKYLVGKRLRNHS